jgi:hypothetical protein
MTQHHKKKIKKRKRRKWNNFKKNIKQMCTEIGKTRKKMKQRWKEMGHI